MKTQILIRSGGEVFIAKESVQPDEQFGDEIPHPVSSDGEDLFRLFRSLTSLNSYHQACIETKVNCTVGLGVEITSPNAEAFGKRLLSVNSDGESIEEVLRKVFLDYENGNGFLEIVWNTAGAVEELFFMPCTEVWRRPRGRSTDFLYRSDTDGIAVGIDRFPKFTPDPKKGGGRSILHFSQSTNLHRYYGLPDWRSVQPDIELDYFCRLYNKRFFENNGTPDMMITSSGAELDKAAEKAIKDMITNNSVGVDNAHKIFYVPMPDRTEMKIHKLTGEVSKDGSFIKTSENCRDRIVAGHRVPPRMVGIVAAGGLGGGGEVEGQTDLFQQLTISPKQRMAVSKLSPVFSAMGLGDVEFQFKRIDTDEYKKTINLYEKGVIDRDEARALEGYEPEGEESQEKAEDGEDKEIDAALGD